jgi:hypothetical protein
MQYYVIESRNADGSLELSGPQPEEVFGISAITGISDHEMAQTIYRHDKQVVLEGGNIASWPKFLNPNWVARPKSW